MESWHKLILTQVLNWPGAKIVKMEQICHVIIKLSRNKLSGGKVQIELIRIEYMLKFNKLRRVANSVSCCQFVLTARRFN